MIVWLNGTFGVGKTTTSRLLTELLPDARIFDSETVGYMLRPVLASVPVADFQDHPPWRALVVETAAQILGYVGGTLVVPQSVLVRAYWIELRDGLAKSGIPLRHFVLHAAPLTLAARIDSDPEGIGIRRWRHDHVAPYADALPWLREEGEIVETVDVAPDEVARRIAAAVSA
ncbi:ATP-binding protein [Streptomyces sp. CBMA29]|uniref:ATP-binding protein n=1 Tax=Streptomyces sp. CBMA29 TaxID=1896314 RepID=UPI001661C950|nr:ATP-binding protein [Streptomyces sp. CBMA29]MBD0737324.1 ATP-binding protein [Streptomyces sp. CBMA29]